MDSITSALSTHSFEHLFIEVLGWDRTHSALTITFGEQDFELKSLAQKRDFIVLACSAHRVTLANRRLLQEVQRHVSRTYHEHIVIYYSETPRKQVWQWMVRVPGGKRIRHREHPFFSDDPPPRLLERLNRLAISWDEEETTTLTDVLSRVREVLLPGSEFDLFAKWPSYAAKSDALAMAVKRGEPGAFEQFVEFHMPLARKASRMLIRWFGMTPEDAEQTAMIGLLEAARRFNPERGFQFSTYASFWIRQACQRHGLEWGFPLRMPDYAFWPCYRMQYVEAELIATWGQHEAKDRLRRELMSAGVEWEQWERFRKARNLACFSDVEGNELRYLTDTSAPDIAFDLASNSVLRDDVAKALASLRPRHSQILSLRYGIGQREHTLQEVADLLGITRERVRQIQVKAEERLQSALRNVGYNEEATDSN
jgi:RNA polymerase sigma factor (sigma-70 family)